MFNFERDQQEQLLNSCLPKHLMEKVRDDIKERFTLRFGQQRDNSISRPFTELYIEKHTNVTILYADIVNSMLLGSSLDPKELVETLDELFGRFDARAEANNCLRIKLLGDCYYCVSGIPEYDPNHALNCINMGFDMIEIIKSVQENSKLSDSSMRLNMRIGIHTGMVLSGLLGLRKWQYDIWSIDSLKASQMEHDGKPGMVHITEETLSLIPANFREKFIIIDNHVIENETTYLLCKTLPTSVSRHSIHKYNRKTSKQFQYNSNIRVS
jgi:class 3 adenylate cyclase